MLLKVVSFEISYKFYAALFLVKMMDNDGEVSTGTD
jgi:hypothetical protein